MENNNILLEEVQAVEVIDNGVQAVETVTSIETQEGSDLTKTILMIGAGALLAATPVVYKKVIKPRFKKLAEKMRKKGNDEVIVDAELQEDIEHDFEK